MTQEKSPIAIVGMSCRFPGGLDTPGKYWEFLRIGGNAIRAIGPDRWSTDYFFHPDPKSRGKSYTWAAGVLPDIDGFDAHFFGISPREAAQIDPQQRILLELAWEAFEDAGLIPRSLAGSDCGVYVGISNMDYANSRYEDPSSGDAYFMTGGVLSIAANRVSYFFDLHGPSMSIDTACSSSLVAVHQACSSIASGECAMALVGGVNVLLTPYPFIGFSRAAMLSPSGKCHAFDAAADGYVRAEGGAMLVLKPLEQARADGDPIRAVIVASGTNSDGRTPGLSLPNERAQTELLRSVYTRAGLEPGELRYIEAHGTGTAAGDPIEATAIGDAVGTTRDHDDPLLIGSVKTNIGHLEPAAGVAGLLKVILSLEHELIPPSIHFQTPNPNIRFDDLNLRVVTQLTPLADKDGTPAMGVNSFGFGGANAHVVVRKQVDPKLTHHAPPREVNAPLFLSAQTHDALLDVARTFKAALEKSHSNFYDICHTAARHRQRFDHRLAVVADSANAVAVRLGNFVSRKGMHGVVSGQTIGRPAKLALLFSGNGAQWQGMGCRLLQQDATFRDWIIRVDELFEPMSGFSILEELERPPEQSSMHLTEVAQPALFAVQVALFESLIARGLEPDAVFGHSVGEVAAAYASGAYTLEQGTRVIYERSRAQTSTRGRGKIAAVGLSAEAARKEITRLAGDLELAGYNSPTSVTVAGPESQLEALGKVVQEQGALYRLLDLDYPFHSRAMDRLRNDLVAALFGLKAFKTRLPFVSTVTGAVLESNYLDAEYWWRNVRHPVRLDKAMSTLMADGFQVFLEIGPHSILQGYLLENLKAANHAGRAVPTLKRDQDDYIQLMEALCTTHVLGCELDLGKLFPVHGSFVRLPHYSWQRESTWYERTSEASGFLHRAEGHPLLGYRVPQVEGIWEREIDLARMPWLADHVVGGSVIFPASGFIELALAACAAVYPDSSPAIEYMNISTPLALASDVTRRLRLELSSDDGRFRIQSRARLSVEPWITHVSGRLSRGVSRALPHETLPVNADTPMTRVDGEVVYADALTLGLAYGDHFRKLAYVDCGTDFALARVNGEKYQKPDAKALGYQLHPARLDACFHGLIGLARASLNDGSGVAYVPVQTGNISYTGNGDGFTHALIRMTGVTSRSVTACFELLDASQRRVALLKGVRFRRLQLVNNKIRTLPVYENVALRHFPDRLQRAGVMPSLATLVDVAGAALAARSAVPERRHFLYRGLVEAESLAATFAAATTGVAVEQGEWVTRSQFADALEVSDANRSWLNQLVMLLEDSKFVERDNGRIRFLSVPTFEHAQRQWQRLLGDFPAYHAELTLVGRCGMHLRDLLTGAMETDALVDNATLARLRAAFQGFRFRDGALREVLKYLAENWMDPRPLRILELGLDGDPPDIRLKDSPDVKRVVHAYAQCRRCVSKEAVEETGLTADASNALGLVPENPAESLTPNSFDVVVVSHLLHEFEDPKAALRQIRRMLAASGLLLVAEPPATPVLDFVRGSSPRWWRSTDKGLGNRSSLRNMQEWRDLLINAGFEAVESVAEDRDTSTRTGFVLIARNNAAVAEAKPRGRKPGGSFLLLAERHGYSRRVADTLDERLRAVGHSLIRVENASRFRRLSADRFAINPNDTGDFSRLFEILDGENKSCTDVVHLMGLSFDVDDYSTALLEVQNRRCMSLINLIQARLGADQNAMPRTWLVTGRAGVLDFNDHPLEQHTPIPSQAPLWGLGRVVANEHAAMDCRLMDLWIGDDADAAALIAAEIDRDDDETEVVLTADRRYVSRMRQSDARINSDLSETLSSNDEELAVELQNEQPGALTRLQWKAVCRKRPGPGEIEVVPRATGLNFRDLMFATGMLPEEAIENGYAGATLGMECAGVVTHVGTGVSEFKVGDEVMGFAPSCFSSRVVTGAGAMAKKPEAWSFEQAATVPVAFFTVVYALKHLGRLSRGERVLIHGAAGGVGVAAIQYARNCGAEIFATAGSKEKRDFLKLMGVPHILDSRSLDFAEEILALTDDVGVDVVLNSLSGEALPKSLSVLRPFGRFLELGKRDFYENTRIGLRPFRENLSYFGIDADQLLIERPEIAKSVFAEVMSLFAQGVFRPLPYRVFPAAATTDAFRYMQRSEHIGKLVVTHDRSPVPVRTSTSAAKGYSLNSDATYLITGGLSGFGLATARWMVERGARCLVLLGRSGAQTEEAQMKVAELKDLGASIHVLKADVADYQSLEDVFQRIDNTLPPLRGLVHSAMVVDDKLVRDLDQKRMRRVQSPKLLGAWNLHTLTQNRDLEFFVLYSSATTSFGNPGLGNYVAANVYLESLAQLRRSQGLPSTAVAWGPISDSGYLARNDAALQALTAFMGSSGLTTSQGFEALELLLQSDAVCGAVLEFDWSVVRRALPAAHLKRYDLFNRQPESEGVVELPERSAAEILAQLPREEARAVITDAVTQIVARIMRLSPDRVDRDASIVELGMDSLMAIEMHMSVNSDLGVNLPVMGLADIPTIAELVDKVMAQEQPDIVEEVERVDEIQALVPEIRAEAGD